MSGSLLEGSSVVTDDNYLKAMLEAVTNQRNRLMSFMLKIGTTAPEGSPAGLRWIFTNRWTRKLRAETA